MGSRLGTSWRGGKALGAWAAGPVIALTIAGEAVAQQQGVTVFIGPAPLYDSIWAADVEGFFADEGLDVQWRLFPSGTTALQTFQTGQGDMVTNGELPGVRHWLNTNKDYRVISVIERDSANYKVTARSDIQTPSDLEGKTVATRVGSTGSWFISEYLNGNGIDPSKVTVKNLDTQVLPTALCQGDIDAFFIWEPFGTRAVEVCPDEAHILDTAEGYIHGYAVLGARPDWLASKEGGQAATAFLQAMLSGKEVAENDLELVVKYAADNYSLSRDIVEAQWQVNVRAIGLDEIFMQDHCKLAEWMRQNDLMEGAFDIREYVWTEGLNSIDSSLVAEIPPPC